jgi:hypothetical protein
MWRRPHSGFQLFDPRGVFVELHLDDVVEARVRPAVGTRLNLQYCYTDPRAV